MVGQSLYTTKLDKDSLDRGARNASIRHLVFKQHFNTSRNLMYFLCLKVPHIRVSLPFTILAEMHRQYLDRLGFPSPLHRRRDLRGSRATNAHAPGAFQAHTTHSSRRLVYRLTRVEPLVKRTRRVGSEGRRAQTTYLQPMVISKENFYI